MKSSYSVSVLGFNPTEQLVLGSIFGLSARRNPKFVRHTEGSGEPDIYLVDADDVNAVTSLVSRNADRKIPTILIGATDHGTGWPRLSRPLQWARLFVAFDISVRPRAAPAPQTAPNVAPPVAAPARAAVTDPLPSMLEDPSFDPEATVVIPGRARLLADMHARQKSAAPPPAAQTPPPAAVEKAPEADAGNQAVPEDADWVMVVDDNLAVREFMRTKLQPFRLNVDYATSGEEAIGLTAKRHYSCVFLDVVMPGIDGYQVCKMVKTRKSAKPTAVVLLTSKGSPFDRIKGKMAGCDAYLTKPVDEEKLLEVIARFLQTTTLA